MLNDISFVIFRMIIALDLYNQAAVLNECASKTFSQSSFFYRWSNNSFPYQIIFNNQKSRTRLRTAQISPKFH